jgi:hypothetical protein
MSVLHWINMAESPVADSSQCSDELSGSIRGSFIDQLNGCEGSKVFMAVTMKSTLVLDVTSCSVVEILTSQRNIFSLDVWGRAHIAPCFFQLLQ